MPTKKRSARTNSLRLNISRLPLRPSDGALFGSCQYCMKSFCVLNEMLMQKRRIKTITAFLVKIINFLAVLTARAKMGKEIRGMHDKVPNECRGETGFGMSGKDYQYQNSI